MYIQLEGMWLIVIHRLGCVFVGCVVGFCGSVCCKTCVYMSQGNTFISNVTQKC